MSAPRNTILQGDSLALLKTLPDGCVQTCVTSPPYFGLRDYGTAQWDGGDPDCKHTQPRHTGASTLGMGKGASSHESAVRREEAVPTPYRGKCGKCGARRIDAQIGLEPTLAEYVAKMVELFAEVRRVLRKDGTLWLNLGDSYANDEKWGGATGGKHAQGLHGEPIGRRRRKTDLKPKDLCGVPWRVAFALQDAGWWLRSDIIWAKPNPMPESVTDRPTRSHEYIFLLTKSERYYYNAEAIKEPARWPNGPNSPQSIKSPYGQGFTRNAHAADKQRGHGRRHAGFNDRWDAMSKEQQQSMGANKRSVWTVATHPFPEAHFATFPPTLIEPCILAGSRPGDLVLDPFMGAGTTAIVAVKHSRDYLGLELNPAYIDIANRRLARGVQMTLQEASA